MDSNLEWSFTHDMYNEGSTINWINTTNASLVPHSEVHLTVRIVAGVTCILSILGSLAIIFSYIVIKSVRSKARELLVHLSIMDLIFASANLIGLTLPYDHYLLHEPTGHEHNTYERVCKAQAFIAVYGTKGSVLWTLGLAVYLYYRIVSRDAKVTKWVVRLLYVVCYILPLYMSLWLLLTDHLGFPRHAHSGGGWCAIVIGDDVSATRVETQKYDESLIIFMTIDIWVILTFVTMTPIYLIVHCYVRKQLQESKKEFLLTTHQTQASSIKADYKFLLVPAVFMVLRVWDIVFGIIFDKSNKDYVWLTCLNAVGDSAQGFFNFVLFCVFQKKVRDYTKHLIYRCVCCCCRMKLKQPDMKDDYDESITPSQMSDFSADPPYD